MLDATEESATVVFFEIQVFFKENSLKILAARSLQTLPFVVETDNVIMFFH